MKRLERRPRYKGFRPIMCQRDPEKPKTGRTPHPGQPTSLTTSLRIWMLSARPGYSLGLNEETQKYARGCTISLTHDIKMPSARPNHGLGLSSELQNSARVRAISPTDFLQMQMPSAWPNHRLGPSPETANSTKNTHTISFTTSTRIQMPSARPVHPLGLSPETANSVKCPRPRPIILWVLTQKLLIRQELGQPPPLILQQLTWPWPSQIIRGS